MRAAPGPILVGGGSPQPSDDPRRGFTSRRRGAQQRRGMSRAGDPGTRSREPARESRLFRPRRSSKEERCKAVSKRSSSRFSSSSQRDEPALTPPRPSREEPSAGG